MKDMMSAQKVVLIGLDACDPALAQKFAAKGVMPNLAKLLETGARAPVENPHGLFVGALWVNFITAVKPERHGFHCWNRIQLENYQYALHTPDIRDLPSFWAQIADAGKRVGAIDVPHMISGRPINGFELAEWGAHDKHHGLHSYPEALCREVDARFGLHPVLRGEVVYEAHDSAPDDWVRRAGAVRTPDEECGLLQDLLAGAEAKRAMVSALMREQEWDLFVAVFGEAHAVGHQQWHLHDPTHPRYDAKTVEAMGGDPMEQVYAAMDRAVGDLQSQCPPDTLFLVYLSHGMGPHYDGDHHLEEVLARLDKHGRRREASTGRPPAKSLEFTLRSAAKAAIPAALRPYLRKLMNPQPLSREERRARQRFFWEPNNTVHGGVRINLAGREPRGVVQPHEVDDLIAEITEGLLEIRNLDTGKPMIRKVERCDRWHKRSPDDAMPDLFLEWDRSGLVENISSPKIGTLHKPYDGWRTGDHRPAGMLLAAGRGVAAGTRMPKLTTEDIGPSVAAAMGVQIRDVDGAPAEWLAQLGSGRRSPKGRRSAAEAAQ